MSRKKSEKLYSVHNYCALLIPFRLLINMAQAALIRPLRRLTESSDEEIGQVDDGGEDEDAVEEVEEVAMSVYGDDGVAQSLYAASSAKLSPRSLCPNAEGDARRSEDRSKSGSNSRSDDSPCARSKSRSRSESASPKLDGADADLCSPDQSGLRSRRRSRSEGLSRSASRSSSSSRSRSSSSSSSSSSNDSRLWSSTSEASVR